MKYTKIYLTVMAICVGGCSHLPSMAPILPLGEPATKLLAVYGAEKVPNYTYKCKEGKAVENTTTKNTTFIPDEDAQLRCVQQEIAETVKSYSDDLRNIEVSKKIGVLALFGLGTASGVNVVNKGSQTALLNLGLAAASFTGLATVLDINQQHKTFKAGVDSLICLMQVDSGIDLAKKALAKPELSLNSIKINGIVPKSIEENFQLLNNETSLSYNNISFRNNGLSNFNFQDSSISDFGVTFQAAFFFTLGKLHEFVTSFAEAQIEVSDLLSTLHSESDSSKQRAIKLLSGLNLIKGEVNNQLFNIGDLSKIYDAGKKAITDIAGKTASKANTVKLTQQTAIIKSSEAQAIFGKNLLGVADQKNPVSLNNIPVSLKDQVDMANEAGKNVVKAVMPIPTEYQTCMSILSGGSDGSPSTTPTPTTTPSPKP